VGIEWNYEEFNASEKRKFLSLSEKRKFLSFRGVLLANKCPACQSDNPDTLKFCGECGSSLREHDPDGLPTRTIAAPVSPFKPDELLAGKYRIIDELGRGGMGIVVRAEDTRLKRTVALKFLSAELMGNSKARERFVQEARAASALEHPNICTIFEIDEAPDGRMFMAMACYEGESLRDRIKRGKLDHTEAISIAVQVARGLAKAHEKGIVHRDIKPGNIFLTHDGQAKILDFGLAKLAADIRLTRTGATLGTVAYMSPEQAQGKPVDHRTDIWSHGVMLYEMLTAQLPFGGETEGSIVYSIIHSTARPLRKADPAIPAEIERVVLKALEKNPADRYRTTGDFLRDLEALAEGLKPLKAGRGLFRGRILGVRKPVFYGASMALAIAAAFVVFTVIIPKAHAGVLDSIAILPIINESGDTEREYFADGLTRELNSELYKVAALTVPPAETILTYKNSDKPPKKIAQELGVKAVVQVSWLQIGRKHRLIYTLSDPFRNKVIATDRLEMEEEDIIILLRKIARAVVGAVKVAVTPVEFALIAGGQKVNPDAYDLLMKGIAYYWPTDPADTTDVLRALGSAQRAVEADPDFALAHAWLAHFYLEMGISRYEDENSVNTKARKAIDRALELDENLAMAYSSRGVLKFSVNWDFTGAEQDFKKALELAPGDMFIPLVYDVLLCFSGRGDEAIASVKSRSEKQKLGWLESGYPQRQAFHYLWAGRYDEALEELKKFPSTYDRKRWEAVATALKGSHTEALGIIDELKDHLLFKDDPWFRRDRAWILALAGRRKEAIEALEEHIAIQARKNIDTAFDEACVYAGLGEKNQVFELLQKAYDKHSSDLSSLLAEWCLHTLHGDPRFEELAKKIGFPKIPTARKR
jgi:TolB-like protein